MAFRIAHVSDIHVRDFSGIRARDFLNKRVTGATTVLGRMTRHLPHILKAMLDDISSQNVDHLAVTGDVSNLSFESEFRAVVRMLSSFGECSSKVSVVPGNHDVYTRKVARQGLFEEHFLHFMRGDIPYSCCNSDEFRDNNNNTNNISSINNADTSVGNRNDSYNNNVYPYVKVFGHVALIGISSAQPRPWFSATGMVGEEQLSRLQGILARPELEGKYKVIMLHHSVLNAPHCRWHRFRKLLDAAQLREVLAQGGVNLVLSGHSHERDATRFAGNNRIIQVRSVPAGGFQSENPKRKACYAIHSISDDGVLETRYRVYNKELGIFQDDDSNWLNHWDWDGESDGDRAQCRESGQDWRWDGCIDGLRDRGEEVNVYGNVDWDGISGACGELVVGGAGCSELAALQCSCQEHCSQEQEGSRATTSPGFSSACTDHSAPAAI